MGDSSISKICFHSLVESVGEILQVPPSEIGGAEIEKLIRLVAAERNTDEGKLLRQYALSLSQSFANMENDFYENGENHLCEALASINPSTVFDIGANVGSWCKSFFQYNSPTELHAFEIVPTTFRLLTENLAELNAQIILNNYGLGEESGEVVMYSYPDNTELASRFRFPHTASVEEIKGKIVKGDDYLAEHGIGHVDFMKIDVEGGEPEVLKGFEDAFQNHSISAVQFEYGQINIFRRFLLIDFYEFFERHDYIIGKLYPHGVEFKDYDLDDENFYHSNFVACAKSQRRLIRSISRF